MKFRYLVTLVLATGVGLFGVINFAHAQDTAPEDKISLTVSPQILDITGNPGQSVTNIFRLTNASQESVVIKVTPKNFVPRGEEGAVDLTEDKTTFSLADWVKVTPETITIPATKTQDFEVTINVPANAEPGSHFGSVVFSTIPPEQSGSAALVSQEIAPVILVKVAGQLNESADIAEFKSEKGFYSNESSIKFVSRIKNTGSVHFKPTAKIQIKNMFGKEIANFDVDKKNVLPDSIRAIPSEYQLSGFKLGRYTATLTMVVGDKQEIKTATTSFTIFPYQTIIPALIISILIILVIIKFRKRIILALRVLSGKEKQ